MREFVVGTPRQLHRQGAWRRHGPGALRLGAWRRPALLRPAPSSGEATPAAPIQGRCHRPGTNRRSAAVAKGQKVARAELTGGDCRVPMVHRPHWRGAGCREAGTPGCAATFGIPLHRDMCRSPRRRQSRSCLGDPQPRQLPAPLLRGWLPPGACWQWLRCGVRTASCGPGAGTAARGAWGAQQRSRNLLAGAQHRLGRAHPRGTGAGAVRLRVCGRGAT
mmetsp:Transcript_115689/g.236549  ORF Transcript_115689/g.236549 Transcript_115689/m.236549 type:complete len:220 (+) Transcript_115689:13-672(+)